MPAFVLAGPIACGDIPALCARLRLVLESGDGDPVVCDVGALAAADAVVVDALARLQLTARGHGRRIVLRHASAELRALIVFMGLRDVVPATSRAEAGDRRAGTTSPYRGTP